ncbi:hypothetical protein PSTG_16259 [Puccinia striiformis f. sp. tritici PST-78]|uniref:Uncharacterized protein n=1 Tax=Puccinia striiformis f. sp. tritici PST-78 TaxID=1165861 RepID=A0A0L0UU63_9BASI|nr:hypothetical protein PSTG_16259 [Puccinia striiformis f. sp. tritici PST-78]
MAHRPFKGGLVVILKSGGPTSTPAGHFHVEIAEDPRGFHGGAPCKGGRTTRVGLATRTPRGHHPWSPHGILGGVRVDAAGRGLKMTGRATRQKCCRGAESNLGFQGRHNTEGRG